MRWYWTVGLAAGLLSSCMTEREGTDAAPQAVLNPDVLDVIYPGSDTYYLSFDTDLYTTPSRAMTVQHPLRPGEQISGVKGHLRRGQTFAVAEHRGDWLRIVSADGANGWIPERTAIDRTDVHEATVLVETSTLQRPADDADPAEPLLAGTLLLITESWGEFAHVSVDNGATCWVRTSELSFDRDELAVSRTINKTRWSIRNHDALAPYYDARATTQHLYGKTKLVGELTGIALTADRLAGVR